ncbi:importin-5 [Hordeum vulgare]|nr:importin-5 [Hordeum vulgare]
MAAAWAQARVDQGRRDALERRNRGSERGEIHGIRGSHPEPLVLRLASSLVAPAIPIELRAMAAVLLRKLLSPTSDSFAAASPLLWPVLSPDAQVALKAQLLAALQSDPPKPIAKKVCDTLLELERNAAGGGGRRGGGEVDVEGAVALEDEEERVGGGREVAVVVDRGAVGEAELWGRGGGKGEGGGEGERECEEVEAVAAAAERGEDDGAGHGDGEHGRGR